MVRANRSTYGCSRSLPGTLPDDCLIGSFGSSITTLLRIDTMMIPYSPRKFVYSADDFVRYICRYNQHYIPTQTR
jgi:hypothetical protein